MTRFDAWPIATHSPAEALPLVLAHAGATLPKRDAVDERVVADVQNRTGRVINSPKDVGGYPTMTSAAPPADSDSDGIPDEWELRHGLNPNDPSDAGHARDGEAYTRIEEYLHELLK